MRRSHLALPQGHGAVVAPLASEAQLAPQRLDAPRHVDTGGEKDEHGDVGTGILRDPNTKPA